MKIRKAVAFVIINDEGQILAVQRPYTDIEFPGVWSLPATLVKNNDSLENTVLRGAMEKLNVTVKIIKKLGHLKQKRSGYELILTDYEVKIIQGAPNILKATTKGTKYIDQKWVRDPVFFREAASKGACCSQVFLLHLGLIKKEDIITSLNINHI